jgi:transcriptional regulator with XRE-family HTH domain
MQIPKISPDAGQILKQLRLKRGLSQVVLAERMNLNNSQHVWNIENGTNNLTLDMLEPAAKALNVSPNVFLSQKVKQII